MKSKGIGERWTLRLIIITPLVALAVLTIIITSFYIDKMKFHFSENAERYLGEYIAGEKRQGERLTQDIELLAQYRIDHLEEKIQEELDGRLELAYRTADRIYEKYRKKLSSNDIKKRILDALGSMYWYGQKNYVFVTDYEGNNILSRSQDLVGKNLSRWEDADGRAIVLEEIQMARKHGEGYLKTRFREETGLQTIKVKDFGHYNWFFGSGIHHERALNDVKQSLLNLIAKTPKEHSSYIAIFENRKPVLISEEDKNRFSALLLSKVEAQLSDENGWVELPDEKIHLYRRYFAPFDWHIVYGFKKGYFDAILQDQQQKMNADFEREVLFVIAASAFITLLVGLFTFMVSRRIILIIRAYKMELEVQEAELRELNYSLEARVSEEVTARREKEKMLIQQSKMAAMGDMISMIAHQWRQPLNQMSYVLMNIDSAYEFKELTQKYMDDKVKEGSQLLEYMSHTIDDFKNFFKPDKARSEEQISEVLEHTVSLVEKSLDAHNIALEMHTESDARLLIYRNELLQVILNLITNAKDALVLGKITEPRIEITITEDKKSVFIRVCDNGGGVDTAIQEKIFEPYFSTKGENSGTGLGLYMARTIVEGHLNGELTVVNSDKGACFTIMLRK